MQKVIIIGNMGSDPEARFTQDGRERLTINVAVNERRKVPQTTDEWADHTDWYRVTVMGRQLEYVRQLAKGSRVHVIGNLSIDAYMSRDNEPRAGLNIWADEVTNLTPRDQGSAPRSDYRGDRDAPAPAGANGGGRAAGVAAANERARRGTEPADALEDLPF